MKSNFVLVFSSLLLIIFFGACSTLEKASLHGFNSGYYKTATDEQGSEKVYVDVTEEKIEVYHLVGRQPERNAFRTISLIPSDSLSFDPAVFRKKSLDIDITAIPLKYRPGVFGLPGQMNTDFNVAMYAGWRNDRFNIISKTDPLGKRSASVRNRGYDFGIFAGPGATLISPFTTRNQRADEYNAMVIQTGIAGFLESNMASFGIAFGVDYLLNSDRDIWIYTNKPWIGFVIGIALN